MEWDTNNPVLSVLDLDTNQRRNTIRVLRSTKILGSESFARWLVSLALALALELELALVLVLDIERYHITASVNDLTCPLPPHQSVI